MKKAEVSEGGPRQCMGGRKGKNKQANFNVQGRKSKRLIGRPCGDGIAQLIRPLAHRTDESILKTTRIRVSYFLARPWPRAARGPVWKESSMLLR